MGEWIGEHCARVHSKSQRGTRKSYAKHAPLKERGLAWTMDGVNECSVEVNIMQRLAQGGQSMRECLFALNGSLPCKTPRKPPPTLSRGPITEVGE